MRSLNNRLNRETEALTASGNARFLGDDWRYFLGLREHRGNEDW